MRVYIREDIILNLTNNILFVNNCIILFLIDTEQLLLLFLTILNMKLILIISTYFSI